MKALYFLAPLLIAGACKTQSGSATISDKKIMEQVDTKDASCPEDGTCTVVLHENSKLVVAEDGTGAIYPQIQPGKDMVVEYTYFREAPEGIADGNYSETIHFEIPTSTSNLSKNDKALQDVKLLFGKHAFAPDAGYYKIENGKLLLEKTGSDLIFDLQFSNQNKSSQLINHITETIRVK